MCGLIAGSMIDENIVNVTPSFPSGYLQYCSVNIEFIMRINCTCTLPISMYSVTPTHLELLG